MSENKSIDPNKNVVLKASQVMAAIERMDKVLERYCVMAYADGDIELLDDLFKTCEMFQDILDHQHELTEEVIFLCDGKHCEVCHNPECHHTTDITHAKNFKKDDDVYWEVEDVHG